VGCPQLRVDRVNMLDHWLHAMLLLQKGRVSIVAVVWLTDHCQTKRVLQLSKKIKRLIKRLISDSLL
jgi:hypothetical protein